MVLALDAQVLDKVSLGVDFRAWGLGLRVDNGDSTKELKTFAAGLLGKLKISLLHHRDSARPPCSAYVTRSDLGIAHSHPHNMSYSLDSLRGGT